MRETVMLRGGAVVSRQALELAWTLEARGCDFALTDDGRIVVRPNRLLSDDERARIRAWKPDLVALVRACDEARL